MVSVKINRAQNLRQPVIPVELAIHVPDSEHLSKGFRELVAHRALRSSDLQEVGIFRKENGDCVIQPLTNNVLTWYLHFLRGCSTVCHAKQMRDASPRLSECVVCPDVYQFYEEQVKLPLLPGNRSRRAVMLSGGEVGHRRRA